MDQVFGDANFTDQAAAVSRGGGTGGSGTGGSGTGGSGTAPGPHRALFWTAGSLAAVLVLVLLFIFGTKLAPNSPAAMPTAKPALSASPSPSASAASPTPTATGPAALGLNKWTQLQGGECVSPYASAWAETFTVVDCASPHAAQLYFRGVFPATEAYPGVAALQSQIAVLCGSSTAINLSAAATYTDIQLHASYAATSAEWLAGNHSYSCFVSRASAQPLAASVAVSR